MKIILNEKYNMLTPVKELGMKFCTNRNRRFYLCRCDCGNTLEVRVDQLGKIKSCGCIKSDSVSKSTTKRHKEKRIDTLIKHNIDISKISTEDLNRLKGIYHGMKGRCMNTKSECYYRYGGRGIKICEEWLNDVYSFIKWSIDNGYDKDLTIDRIDNNRNYEPNNCRWADNITQCRNRNSNVKVNYNDKSITLTELSEIVNIPIGTLSQRHKYGDRKERLIRPIGENRKINKGSKVGTSIVNEEIVVKIKKLLKENKFTQKEISARLNVSIYIVSDIKRNKTWTHIQV